MSTRDVISIASSIMDELTVKTQGRSDLRDEIRALLRNADEWMDTPNTILDGKKPNELIGTRDEQKVRDIVQAVIYSSME